LAKEEAEKKLKTLELERDGLAKEHAEALNTVRRTL
jgi:hypothetical protein